MVLQVEVEGGSGTVAMQGASEFFREYAGMTPAGYALAWAYSDELALSEIAAVERPKVPDWDAREGPPIYNISEAFRRSTPYLLSWAPLFAADFATQALKSIGWLLGFPALFVRSDPPVVHSAAQFLLPLYDFLGKPWMPLLGLVGFVALLWRAHLRSPLEAACMLLLLLLLMGYPGIQFSLRHVFHLEFVWVVCLLSLLSLVIKPEFSMQRAGSFAAMLVSVIGVGALSYMMLIGWQRSVLSGEIQALVSAPRETLATQSLPRADGSLFYGLPVPTQHAAIIASEADTLSEKRFIALAWDVRAEADRLVVTIDGSRCPAGIVKLGLDYATTDGVWKPMDAGLSLTVPTGGLSASAFFPVFYRPTQHFSGLVLPASHAQCSLSLERIGGSSVLPLVMSGQFAGEKLIGPLNKGFGSFSVTSHIEGNITQLR